MIIGIQFGRWQLTVIGSGYTKMLMFMTNCTGNRLTYTGRLNYVLEYSRISWKIHGWAIIEVLLYMDMNYGILELIFSYTGISYISF